MSSSSWLSWPRVISSKQAEVEAEEERKRQEEVVHRKRLASILRYIASMHQALRSADGTPNHSFVRSIRPHDLVSDFFQYERNDDDFESGSVLFSTADFRKLIAAEAMDGGSTSLWSSPPFSFYASSASTAPTSSSTTSSPGKKTAFGSLYSSPSTSTVSTQRGQGLWLRLTRLGPNMVEEQPDIVPIVEKYLNGWLQESAPRGCITTSDLLTIHHLERAPGIPSTVYSIRNQRIIRVFLKKYKRFLRMKLYQQTLEPIYNRLFEWIQQQNENNEELVWGLGHAKLAAPDGSFINGPLLEVLVEVELAPDGGLLVKPRQHTGVSLNREIVSALVAADPSAQHSTLSSLHRTVGEMESTQLSPAQPTTYVSLLKRIAVEISPGGSFQASASNAPASPTSKKRRPVSLSSKLMVSEAWCLYSRSKPSSVWARDANTLADNIALPENIGLTIPMATWSLTHGPSKLEGFFEQKCSKEGGRTGKDSSGKASESGGGIAGWLSSNFIAPKPSDATMDSLESDKKSLIFPLATSDSQHRIADLLLQQNYAAVLAEGPPGTGKTHSIANIVSAYLCQGKRVLVTSKNANALNVLRGRLPKSIQELCVDVTMSELQGMRQLQQTVERLAIRVSAASTEVESEKCHLLQRSIDNLETQLQDIDEKFTQQSENLRQTLHGPSGVALMELSSHLARCAPWLMRTLPEFSLEQVELLSQKLRALKLEKSSSILTVSGFDSPPPKAFISLALARSGSKISTLANATRTAVASLPIVGATMDVQLQKLNEDLEHVRIKGRKPESSDDWKTISDALKHSLSVHSFEESYRRNFVKERGWPEMFFDEQAVVKEMNDILDTAVEVKRLQISLNAEEEIYEISKSREMDAYRARLATQIRHHSEELADAAVITELSRSFSPDAQSALIRFSQIAGAAKFSKSAKPSKMTARQRRRRLEYLEAFDRCVRQIPCWIMTSSQISQYLPAETLFDLVVIDESSQSDITVLPGMMRGKQWLIVGDGKQVSPTEAFVSDDDIDNLKASLPTYCPFSDALLPGRSFFDMCAQAFPRGRVVLSEHFRCAPEIINFSNRQFYDGRLVPLRLPRKGERLTPSLIDIKLSNGVKTGKVNEQEADKIVEMIRETMEMTDDGEGDARTIGIISLMGDDQSRLIRGRLLDAVGPEKIARHEVLIGDPPTFQGAERDIIFLSMVCSPGSAPTQNQQFHFQRANVAMSRARDRCVLVRSLDLKDIPSLDDSKVPIIEFFMQASLPVVVSEAPLKQPHAAKSEKKRFGVSLLKFLLDERGYDLVDMGIVWKDAICIEHYDSDTRAAIMIDCEESSSLEWRTGFAQQKAIERVGWKCLRIDALTLVVKYDSIMKKIVEFLASAGIPDPYLMRDDEDEASGSCEDHKGHKSGNTNADELQREIIEIDDNEDDTSAAGAAGSKNGGHGLGSAPTNTIRPDSAKSTMIFDQDESIEASRFGEVVDLNFLLRPKPLDDDNDGDDDGEDMDGSNSDVGPILGDPPRIKRVRRSDSSPGGSDAVIPMRKRRAADSDDSERPSRGEKEIPSDEENLEAANQGGSADSAASSTSSKRQKRRRMDNYARDGRWYPGSAPKDADPQDGEWYDTDSDLPNEKADNEDDGSWQDDNEKDVTEETSNVEAGGEEEEVVEVDLDDGDVQR